MRVLVGCTRRPATGETICGDAYTVAPFPHGTLLCLADGLGHGASASAAAEVACTYARDHAEASLEALLRGIDAALGGTRGAAVSLLALLPSQGRLFFAGVGNVELHTRTRARISSPTASGILGRGVRRVRVWEHPLAEGDLFLLTSDGVSSQFDLDTFTHHHDDPQALADALVQKHGKAHDDASCVVARIVPRAR